MAEPKNNNYTQNMQLDDSHSTRLDSVRLGSTRLACCSDGHQATISSSSKHFKELLISANTFQLIIDYFLELMKEEDRASVRVSEREYKLKEIFQ